MKWLAVFDFDGTLSQDDVGNTLGRTHHNEVFQDSYKKYKAGLVDLATHQKNVWDKFPLNQQQFRSEALRLGQLAVGAVKLLDLCHQNHIPVIIASCGLMDYIEPILRTHLSPPTFDNIQNIYANDALFDQNGLTQFIPSPYAAHGMTVDKGRICQELRGQYLNHNLVAIGNGTSDRTFAGHVDQLMATDGLHLWCVTQKVPHLAFTSLLELCEIAPFKTNQG